MSTENSLPTTALQKALRGHQAHLGPQQVLGGLTVAIANEKPGGSPYSIWNILRHIQFWQEQFWGYLSQNPLPPVPSDAIGWPGPDHVTTQEELQEEITRFMNSLEQMELLLDRPEVDLTPVSSKFYESGWEAIQALICHNSYHLGQILLLRRMQGDYPPPGGGYTWGN